MVRVMAILGVFCFLGAVGAVLLPDPWSKAEQKATQDAKRLADLMDTPDKISWRLLEDASLLRTMIWDANGARRYPPPEGMAPLPYEFSDDAERLLTSFQTRIETGAWVPFDMAGRELLYCSATPAICLVYDRAALEAALQLRSAALSSDAARDRTAILLAVLGTLLTGACFWLRRRSQARETAFQLIRDRHIAIRDMLEVSLTPRDLKLLSVLEERGGAVVTKDELYDAGWGRDYMPNSRALDQHIINLRRKLDPDKSRPVLIETVHGVGYRLVT